MSTFKHLISSAASPVASVTSSKSIPSYGSAWAMVLSCVLRAGRGAGCDCLVAGPGRARSGGCNSLTGPGQPGGAGRGRTGGGPQPARGRARGMEAACQGPAGGRAGAEMGGLEHWPGGPGESCGQPLCYNTNSYNAVLFPHAVRYTQRNVTLTVLPPIPVPLSRLSPDPARPLSPVLNIAGNLLITFLHFHQMYKEF